MRLKRAISLLTGVCFILNELLMAAPAYGLVAGSNPSALEVEVQNSFKLQIPAELGTIESISTGSGPTLIHIQEAHGNAEVQKNISKILAYLKNEYGFSTVYLEGNASPLKPELIEFFPEDRDKTRETVNTLLENGIASGPELYFVDEPGTEALGIEDLKVYDTNKSHFLEVLKKRKESQSFLNDMEIQIERLTSPYLNKDLRMFLSRVEAYEKKKIPFGRQLQSK